MAHPRRWARPVALAAMAFVMIVASPPPTPAVGRSDAHERLVTTTRVRMVDDLFRPRTASVARGTVIKWVNRGDNPHTTTSRTGLWNKTLAPGESYSRRFRKAGTFRYHCVFHDDMIGKIVVG